MKKTFRPVVDLTVVIIIFTTFLGCASDENDSRVQVRFNIPAKVKPTKSWLSVENFLTLGERPGSSTQFECLALNVIGPGIPSVHSAAPAENVVGLIDGGSQCVYPGITSKLVETTANTATEIALDVPAGTPRLLQVIGINASTKANCSSIENMGGLWKGKYFSPTDSTISLYSKAYEVGRKSVSLSRNQRVANVAITDAWDAADTKPIFIDSDKSKNCASTNNSGTSGRLGCSMTTSVLTTLSGAPSYLKRKIPLYVTNGSGTYSFSGSSTLGTIDATQLFNYSQTTDASDTANIQVEDTVNGTRATCSIHLKNLNGNNENKEFTEPANQILWLTADQTSDSNPTTLLNRFSSGINSLGATTTSPVTTNTLVKTSPYFDFIGSSTNTYTTPYSATQILSSFGLYVVAKFNATKTAVDFLRLTTTPPSNSITMGVSGTGNTFDYVASFKGNSLNVSGANTDSQFRLHALTWNGTQIKYYVSGFSSSTAEYNTADSVTFSNIAIGSESVSRTFDGDIAEVVIVGNPSVTQMGNIQTYLESKYGL